LFADIVSAVIASGQEKEKELVQQQKETEETTSSKVE